MKVAFLTLGCKVNFYETEQMMEQFQTLGFDVVDFQEKADVYIVNTCTVTNPDKCYTVRKRKIRIV